MRLSTYKVEKFAVIHEQRTKIRYRHRRTRGWTTIESYGNGMKVVDPVSKGQKDHPCRDNMSTRRCGVTGSFKKWISVDSTRLFFETSFYKKSTNQKLKLESI